MGPADHHGGTGGDYEYTSAMSAPPNGVQAAGAAGPCLIDAYVGSTSDPLWQLGGARVSVTSVASTGGQASVRSLSMPGSHPVSQQAVAHTGFQQAGAMDVEVECEVFERHTYGGGGVRGSGHGGGNGWASDGQRRKGGEEAAATAAAATAGTAASPAAAVAAPARAGARSAGAGSTAVAGRGAATLEGAAIAGENGSSGCILPQLMDLGQRRRHEVADAGHSNSSSIEGWAQGRSEAGGGGAVATSASSPSGRPAEPSGLVPLPPLAPPPSSPPQSQQQPKQPQHLPQGQHAVPCRLRFDMSGGSGASQQALRCSRRSCDGAFAGGSSGGRSHASGRTDGCSSDDDSDVDDLGLVSGALRRAAGAQVTAALTTKSTGMLLQLPGLDSGPHHAHHARHAHAHAPHRHPHHCHQQYDCGDDPHHPQGYHYLHHQQEQDARLARAQARSRSRAGWRHSDCGEYGFAQTAAATMGGDGAGGSTSRRFAECGGDAGECGEGCSSRNRGGSSTCSGAYGSYSGEEAWRVGASGSLGSRTGPLVSARTASVVHGVATYCGQGSADMITSASGGGAGAERSGRTPQFTKSSASLAATAVSLGGAGLLASTGGSTTALAATTGHGTAASLSGPSAGHLRINLRAALPGTVTSRAAMAADLVRCLSHARRHARGGSGSGGDGSGGGASPTASAAPSPLMGEGGYGRARSRRERPN